jgi:hypothetical protein
MILVRKYQSRALAANISLLLFMSVVAPTFAADYLEIQISLDTTFKSPTQTNDHEITAICILGTNDWYISGPFVSNANVEIWLTGTNVIERQTTTSSVSKPPPPMFGQYPSKGDIYTRTNSWLEPFGYGVERVVWLALCSGSFLHTPSRQIPLPIGHFSQSQGYSDKTVFLDDQSDLSPPKTVDLFTTNGTLVSHYEVLGSTNVLGSTIPLQFRLNQYGNGQRFGTNSPQYTVIGRVISIKPRDGPPVPDIKPTP